MTARTQAGVCTGCARTFRLVLGGVVRFHAIFGDPCPGEGKPPKLPEPEPRVEVADTEPCLTVLYVGGVVKRYAIENMWGWAVRRSGRRWRQVASRSEARSLLTPAVTP